jgi:hypothetical protein
MTKRWLWGGIVAMCIVGPTPVLGNDREVFPFSTRAHPDKGKATPPPIPLERIHPGVKDKVRSVLERPALTSRGQSETFQANGIIYRWLLDHPDLTVKLWKQIGAKVSDIQDRGDGIYFWQDEQGSEVNWHSALKMPGLHLWYAEGKVKPGALLPTTNFRALAIMTYQEGKDSRGGPAIRHQVHFLIRCDSRSVTLAARILGASAPRMAEQYLGQLQMFYGGMAWYLCQDEARARNLFRQIGLVVPTSPTP